MTKFFLGAFLTLFCGSVAFAATATLTPASKDYGNVALGGSATQTFTITAVGGAITVTSATVSAAPFLKTSDTCTGATLAAAGTCTVDVQFNPVAVGVSTGTLTVVTNATDGTNKISALRGTGVNGPTLGLSVPSNDFGNVTIGSSSSFTLTVTNTAGTGNLNITSATASAAPFLKSADSCTGASLVSSGSCTVTLQFNPTVATFSTGTLTIVSNAANGTSQVVALLGTGVTGVTVTGSISPTSFNFGNVTIGSSSTTTFTITNTGGTGNLTIASATVSAAPFLKTGDTCTGASLVLAGTCTVTVQFNPVAAALSAATLTVVTNATDGTNKIASLIGTGVTGVTVTGSISPTSFNFGNVTIGSSSTTTFTITNTGGTGSLTIASATVSAAPFLKTGDTCTGASLVLAGTCTVTVQFNPVAAALSAATLTVVTNATDGTNKIASLIGTGVTGVTVTGSISPTSFNFGNVTIGSSSTTTFTITNTGGTGSLTIASATVSAAPFLKVSDTCTGASLAALGTCTVGVAFNPTVVTASAATLTVVTNATDGTNKIVSLLGTGVTGITVTGSISPTSFNFGNVTLGSSSTTSFTITNTGGTGNLTITSVNVSGAPFVISSDTCTSASLVALGTCTVGVSFNPTAVTSSSAVLTVVTNATNGINKIASLAGAGVTGVTVTGSISPTSFDFGNVTLGSASTTTFTITNTGGTGSLTIASAIVSAAPFLKTADTCTGASLVLAGTCTVTVQFIPVAAALSAATLTLVTNATDGTNKIASLLGTGVTGVTVTGSISPASFNFGNVTLGSTSTTSFTITNTGGTGSLTISGVSVSGAPFMITSDTCAGAALAALGTCTVGVAFNPTAVSSSAALLTVVTNATNGVNKIAALTGAGVTGVTVTGSISPATANFGSVAIGSSGTKTFIITNTGGTGSLTITGVAVSGVPFVISSDSCTAASLPLSGTCSVGVDYVPTTTGPSAGTLTVATNATNGISKIASFSGSTPLPGTLEFGSSGNYEFNDDVGTAVVFVTRSSGSLGAVTVDYATAPGTASVASGDYDDASGTLTWADGDASPKKISITIHQNLLSDHDRQLSVVLTNPTGGAGLGVPSFATVTLHSTKTVSAAATAGTTNIDNSGCSLGSEDTKRSSYGFSWSPLLMVALFLFIRRHKFSKI